MTNTKQLRKGVYFIINSNVYPDFKNKVFKILFREYDRIHCICLTNKIEYAQTISANQYKLITIIDKKIAKVLYE